MSIDLTPAGEDHLDGHGRHAGHPHPAVAPANAVFPGSGSSPLWWSASQRLVCAALLVAILWLVIAWAVA